MRWLRGLALTLTVLLASTHLLFGAALLWAKNTDHQIIVVSGGSMAPTFEVGDVIVVNTDPSKLKPGDIITYQSNQGLTTHRLVEFHEIDGITFVQTKGDANKHPDPDFTPLGAVVGSVEKSFEDAGYLLNFMSSRKGVLVTLSPLLFYVIIVEMAEALRIWREEDEDEDESPPSKSTASPGRHLERNMIASE